MSQSKSRLFSGFEVRRLSHTIVEYSASIEGRAYFSRQWWLHIFLRHRIVFSLITIFWIIALFTSRHNWSLLAFWTILHGIMVYLIFHNLAIEESVTIIQQFGLQLKRRYFFGREKIQFVEKERLSAVFIHEFFKGCQVRFGLAFELKSRLSADNHVPTSVHNKAIGNQSPPNIGNLSPSVSHVALSSQQASTNTNSASSGLHNASEFAENSHQSGSTKLVVLFQEVYPGYDSLKKVYRACAIETDYHH